MQVLNNFFLHKSNSFKIGKCSRRKTSFFIKVLLLVALFPISSSICNETSSLFFLQPKLAGIIKIKPRKDKSYKDLSCSEEERANIYYIIHSMGNKGTIWLLTHKSELEEKGQQINGIHPLKFLEVVFADPILKSCMPIIFNDYFKRKGFIHGLTPNMTQELNRGKLEKYLKDFMKAIKLDLKYYDELLEIAKQETASQEEQEKKWTEFVRFLFTH